MNQNEHNNWRSVAMLSAMLIALSMCASAYIVSQAITQVALHMPIR